MEHYLHAATSNGGPSLKPGQGAFCTKGFATTATSSSWQPLHGTGADALAAAECSGGTIRAQHTGRADILFYFSLYAPTSTKQQIQLGHR
jgi:hypothetical protein